MGEPLRTALLLLVLTAIVTAIAVGSMWEDSATADEAAHIASGLLKLREGRVDFYATQAPLVEAIEALPLALAGYRVPDVAARYANRPWVVGHILLYRAGYDAQTMLRLARLPVIAMLLALCFAVFLFVRSVTGSAPAACAGFAMTGLCPTLLAHGRLATVDVGLALFAFAAGALFWQLLQKPTLPLALATGAMTACALLAKVSGAIVVPFFLLAALVHLVRLRRLGSTLREAWRKLMLAAAAALIVFTALYLLLARSLDLTLPFRQYVSVVRAVGQLYGDQYALPQFLLGEFSHRGWPHYNLVAMAVKTPLPLLLLLAIGIGVWRRGRSGAALFCYAFAALFLSVSAFSSLNLGIRHILPIYPFLYAATAISLFEAWKRGEARERRGFGIAIGVVLAAQLVTTLLAYPSYVSYFNPLIGGHRNADRILIDSNLDWGQDLRRLRQWARANDAGVVRVHYFGAGSVEHELGRGGLRWAAPRPELLPPGYFAVSRHFYRLSWHPKRSPIDYDAYLQASHAQYVTSIGGSIDVYRVPPSRSVR